ncbi:hypothetical protein IW261DRAFT_1596801 [Armillaria novae-zelandiae]|uniref:Uncharacterized protein n=1 Tax=Armillaria novae-zelandiae TaxID=153914 RepID=A0AA39NV80_9AGAR|nr:hypothetical protein IW261DRAFT_1596801 [Armillaria novae-zelandiae]
MPTTKRKNAGSSKCTDFLDATREFTDAGSQSDHESEEENSPGPANRGVERHIMTVSRTNRQQTWKILSNLCGYRSRVAGEDWEHYCKRSLRNFGKALLKEATDMELEAVRLAMDKEEYAHLVLTLDTTDSESSLKNVQGTGTGARKRVHQSNTPDSIHSPSKKARKVTERHSSPQDGEFLSTSRFTQNLWNTNSILGQEVKNLRRQLEAQWKIQEALETDKSALEEEVLALRDLVGQLVNKSEADKKALRAVKMAMAERAKTTEAKNKVRRGHE